MKIPCCGGCWTPSVVEAVLGGPVRTGEAAHPGRTGVPPVCEAVVSGRGACSTLEALQARLAHRISAWMTAEAFAGSRWDVASPSRQQGAFLPAPSRASGYPRPVPTLPPLPWGYEAQGAPLRAGSHPAAPCFVSPQLL